MSEKWKDEDAWVNSNATETSLLDAETSLPGEEDYVDVRLSPEEAKRRAEEKRREEEKRQAEEQRREEKKRKAEAKRRAGEQRKAEEKRQAEEQRRAEEQQPWARGRRWLDRQRDRAYSLLSRRWRDHLVGLVVQLASIAASRLGSWLAFPYFQCPAVLLAPIRGIGLVIGCCAVFCASITLPAPLLGLANYFMNHRKILCFMLVYTFFQLCLFVMEFTHF